MLSGISKKNFSHFFLSIPKRNIGRERREQKTVEDCTNCGNTTEANYTTPAIYQKKRLRFLQRKLLELGKGGGNEQEKRRGGGELIVSVVLVTDGVGGG